MSSGPEKSDTAVEYSSLVGLFFDYTKIVHLILTPRIVTDQVNYLLIYHR